MADSVEEAEAGVKPEVSWWKEIPEEADVVLKRLGLEIDRGLPQNKKAIERGEKSEWDWKETFVAVCRVVEETEELGLEPGEQIWVKAALKERKRGKGIGRVGKEGAKLSGLTKAQAVNEDVSINLPTLHFAGEVEGLPVIVREFVFGYPVDHKLTEPRFISPVAEEWHHWRALVCPVKDFSPEEEKHLVVSESFDEVWDEVVEKNLTDFEEIVSSGESELSREVQRVVGYSVEEIRARILGYKAWYQDCLELCFRLDDNTPRNWVIKAEEGEEGQGWIVDYGSARFGSKGRSLHDAVYWLAHIWRPEQGEVREATVAGFCRDEDDRQGICFNTLVRLPGTLARELRRAVKMQEKGENHERRLMRSKALGAMVKLAMEGFESFEVGIGPLCYPQES